MRHPEFATAQGSLVQACLDAAESELSADDLGTSFNEAHGLLAAHKLASSPYGTSARLEAGKETTYQSALAALLGRVIVPVGAT